jgi:hypothetical protein
MSSAKHSGPRTPLLPCPGLSAARFASGVGDSTDKADHPAAACCQDGLGTWRGDINGRRNQRPFGAHRRTDVIVIVAKLNVTQKGVRAATDVAEKHCSKSRISIKSG